MVNPLLGTSFFHSQKKVTTFPCFPSQLTLCMKQELFYTKSFVMKFIDALENTTNPSCYKGEILLRRLWWINVTKEKLLQF